MSYKLIRGDYEIEVKEGGISFKHGKRFYWTQYNELFSSLERLETQQRVIQVQSEIIQKLTIAEHILGRISSDNIWILKDEEYLWYLKSQQPKKLKQENKELRERLRGVTR